MNVHAVPGAGDAPGDWKARLELDPSAFIAPGAVVVGTVRLGPRSSVWFNTVLRGDTDAIEIGADSNVQDNSTVHVDAGQPARVGARVTIGHRAVIHGCVIEDDCLIGMGSVVLSGARIGAGSLIGAASLVRENQVIPPGSLALGAPARVVGPVADGHRASIRNGAEHYVALSRSYLARGMARPHAAAASDTGITARNPGLPMTHVEWAAMLAEVAAFPAEALRALERNGEERWRRAPGPGRWSAHEVVAHLRTADREVFLPRLATLLERDFPAFGDVAMASRALGPADEGRAARALIAEWEEVRRALAQRLGGLGPAEWARSGIHSLRGPYSVADLARGVREHDASHRRQIARTLEERP